MLASLLIVLSLPKFRPPVPHGVRALPSTANCSLHWIEQPFDHFSYSAAGRTLRQRYYINADHWDPGRGPIFFYVGNEADVGLYVNATGLMWENAASFGALLVFAEHRFYGASMPNDRSQGSAHPYLTHELALADYAILIHTLRRDLNASRCAVITFGGSYGGKLSAWMRLKYPSAVAGAISASAPLLAFSGEEPAWDSGSYYRVITRTASHYSPNCAANVRSVFPLIEAASATPEGRAQLASAFRLCSTPSDVNGAAMLRYFVRDAFDELAMGNYPWPSNYIAGTAAKPMPSWPMHLACSEMNETDIGRTAGTTALFAAVRRAVSVLYNVSGEATCFSLPLYPTPLYPSQPMDGIWDWQWCTEQMPDSFWFSTDGKADMFWHAPYNVIGTVPILPIQPPSSTSQFNLLIQPPNSTSQ
jgi:lysosomal Pro-X carboxypeptidase